MSISSLVNSFTIPTIDIVGIPVSTNVFNEFDNIGWLLGLPRLPNETNADYKHRLLDVNINRANATYLGLLNGISREFGLAFYKPFRIYPKKSGNEFIGANPVVVFNGPYIELWSDYYEEELEFSIDRFEQDGVAYNMADLATYINTNSSYFTVDLVDETYKLEKSMVILNQSNRKTIQSEVIPLSERFTLVKPGNITSDSGGSIILDTVFFSDRNAFQTRVSSVPEVNSHGNYYLNKYTGDVVVFTSPQPGTSVRYDYIEDFYRPLASPVIIHDLQSDNFKTKMFEQVLSDDGTYTNGIPTIFGAQLINQLYSLYPLYFKE